MHQPHRPGGRQMRGQPGDQTLHLVDRLGLGGAILFRPALDLARHVVLAAPEIAEPDRRRLERMQPRDRGVHGVIDRAAFGRGAARHLRLPEHAALDMAHDVEGGADNLRVVAIEHRRRHGKFLRMQRTDDAEFAVDRVRGGQELAGRLAAQHVSARRRLQQIGRVRLPALELAHAERAGKALHARRKISLQPRRIEAQRRRDVLGAGERGLAVDGRHGSIVARMERSEIRDQLING